MDNGKKNIPNILTTNDIRENARNWTLAGDVGLLAHLERFSENIINKTQQTQKNFNQLVDDYEELHAKVGNITNQFLALQNCQFVENRVYDEETPTEEEAEVKVQSEADQEKLLLMQYKEVVEVGVKLLDTHFQEVQLPPNSDSDDEDEVSGGNSVIWKPKNPYANKKFPLLIGSAEWWADDQVGLRPNDNTIDKDKIGSESESDVESLKSIEKTTKLSSSSSMENIKSIPNKAPFLESTEDLFGFDKNENLRNNDDLSKRSNSLSEEPVNFLPEFDKEPETEIQKRGDTIGDYKTEEQVEEKPKEEEKKVQKKVDNEFTRELMAKLVSVTNKTEKVAEKKEEKVAEVLPPAKKNYTDESLFDETDDSSDLFSTTINKMSEKTEGKRNLFFDAENDDELFKGENDLFSGSSLFGGGDFKSQPVEKNNLGSVEPKNPPKKEELPPPPKKSLVNDLFDDLDDDDTLFAVKPVSHKEINKSLPEKEIESKNKTKSHVTSDLSWGSDEGLFDSKMNNEIDDDFFSSSGLFDTKVKKPEEPEINVQAKNPEPTPKEFETVSKKPEATTKPETKLQEQKKSEPSVPEAKTIKIPTSKNSLNDPFGFSSTKESSVKKLNLLDVECDDDEEDDLFSKKPEEKKPSVRVTTLPDDDDDTSLFSDKPKPPDSVSVSSSRSSLFDDLSASKSRLASVFEKDKTTKLENDEDSLFEEKPGKDLFSRKREEKSSLFDDCDDGDDLFGGGKGTFKGKPEVDEERSLFSEVKTVKEKSEVDGDGSLFSEVKTVKGRPEVHESLFSEVKTVKGKPEVVKGLFPEVNTAKGKPEVNESLVPEVKTAKGKPEVDEDESLFSEVKTVKGKPEVDEDESLFSEVKAVKGKPEVNESLVPEVKTARGKPEVNKSLVPEVKTAKGKPEVDEDESLFSEVKIVKGKPEVDEDGNLFSEVKTSKSDIFKHSNLFSDDLFSDKLTTNKPKPPSSLSLKPETETKSQAVGKLNIPNNLKFKFESAAKHISGGGAKPQIEEKKEEEKVPEGLDESVQPSGLLKCPSKDRVKIPGRRRPQSRKARQEAIRNSGTWDRPASPTKSTTAITSKESPVASNPLSPSTDEEDFFKVPELDTNFEKEDQSIFKSDLFESSVSTKLDDNLLFDGAPVLSPLASKTEEKNVEAENDSLFGKSKMSSIFDDDDLNDENLFKITKPIGGELFSQSQKTEMKKPEVKKAELRKPEVKKPLFDAIDDEDEDEDDLFGGKTHVIPKIPETKRKEEGGEKKEKGNSSFVDPLGLMTGNE